MGGSPVGYLLNMVAEVNSAPSRTKNPDSGRVEVLNQGPQDFKSSALNCPATMPPILNGNIYLLPYKAV